MYIKYNRIRKSTGILLFSLLVLAGSTVQAQISGGEVKPEKEKKEEEKKEKSEKKDKKDDYQRVLPPFQHENLTGSTYYFTVLGQYTNRYFEDNSVYNIHAEKLNETGMYLPGVTLGTVFKIKDKFALDAGLSYFGNGEQYHYEDPNSDSTFTYSNVYTQIGIPLKLRYTIGTDVQFYAFAGGMPLNILTIRRRSSYKSAEGVQSEELFEKFKQDFTPFNFMLMGGLGLNYYVNYFGLTLNVEYRRHMGNTYSTDTFKRVHKMYGIGINLGLTYRL